MSDKNLGDMFTISPMKRILLFTLALSFLFSVTAFAVASPVYDIEIIDGDEVIIVSTYKTETEEILNQAGISLFEGDEVEDSAVSAAYDGTIRINRGVKVTVVSADDETTVINIYGTVADAIEKASVAYTLKNAINYPLDQKVFEGMTIKVFNKYSVTVKYDGKEKTGIIAGKTVEDACKALKIVFGKDDITVPDLKQSLVDKMTIEVLRVTKKTVTQIEKIYCKTVTKNSSDMYVGDTKVQTYGKNGQKKVTYEYCYINGELSQRKVISEVVTRKAVDKVVLKGMKKAANVSSSFNVRAKSAISEMAVPSYVTIGSNGLPENYKKSIRAKATAYCIPGGTTSTGKRAQTGYIAVDPREIPYGTEMYIVSADGKYVYGYCIAADTGGFIYSVDWTVDLYMNSTRECINWGRRDIIIYFL
ncbi:MAG: Resuscitation-promoting factor Rpf2 precursor [Firmicutes bacterium ADurb.Bin300]|nr:MAG: Resuscitation-promoting factor Rpf2 precursor [Firmicutes bacterium ADurb.Bin300]